MKPDAAIYEKIPPLPPNWRRNRKKGVPEVFTAYCSRCGQTLPLERDEGIAGVDGEGKPFVNQCLMCQLEVVA